MTASGNRPDDNYIKDPSVEIVGKVNSSQDGVVCDAQGIAPTHTAGHGNCPKIISTKREYRIRKLTPRECFRLMGVSEGDIDKIQAAGISNAQQYKLAGNSIVVQVLEKIFAQMLRFNEL